MKIRTQYAIQKYFIIAIFSLSILNYEKTFAQSDNLKYIDKQLALTANYLNKSCPIMAGNNVRLNKVTAIPGNVFQYNYSILDVTRATFDYENAMNVIVPQMINGAKTNPDMKSFRDLKTTLIYNYFDKNGTFIIKVKITPEMYLKK